MTNSLARILFASASLVLSSSLFIATASADEPVHQTTVHYGDLNLANAVGRATLNRRLDVAADHVCAESFSRFEEMSCRTKAITKARAELQQRAIAS